MMARELDTDGTFKRIKALDALYLNADRRMTGWMVIDPRANPKASMEAYDRYQAAKRAYEQIRDTPYTSPHHQH